MRAFGAVLAGFVAVAVAAPVAAFTMGDRTSAEGPVRFIDGEDNVQAAYVKADVDDMVVFGANVVRNRSNQPVRLEAGDLVDAVGRPGAHVVDVRVMDPASTDDELVGAARWPFEDFRALSRPIAGYLLGPRDHAAVLFIVKVDRPGGGQWRTTQVAYTAQGRRYRAHSAFGFAVCAPPGRPCEPDLD